jgi:5-methylcytosine-specific restriction endonuclease McrA
VVEMAKLDDETKVKFIELRNKGWENKRIAEEMGISPKTVLRWRSSLGLPERDIEYKYKITCACCGNEYLSRHKRTKFCSESCRGKYNKNHRGHKLVCVECGGSFKNYSDRKYCSDSCKVSFKHKKKLEVQKQLERKREIEKKYKQIEKLRNSLYNISLRSRTCYECKEEYILMKGEAGFKYCSKSCKEEGQKKIKRKRNRISKDKRWRKNGKPDYSISLERLHKRDGGICYICNKNVDYNDFSITDEGHFISGDKYPSIDHVIPIAKGGLHKWNNVKLAHRRCNYLKRDENLEFQTFFGI